MMTRKHYKAIASILKRFEGEFDCIKTEVDFVNALCIYFKSDNPNFSMDTFKEAIYND